MKRFLIPLALVAVVLCAATAQAAPRLEEALSGLGASSSSAVARSVKDLGDLGDPAALPALEALMDGRLRIGNGQPVILSQTGHAAFALSGQDFPGSEDELKKPKINNKVRRELKPVIAQLQLVSPVRAVRLAAASELAEKANPDSADAIEKALAREKDDEIAGTLRLALALTSLKSPDTARKIAAIESIGSSGNQNFIGKLNQFTTKDADGQYLEQDKEVLAAALKATTALERKMIIVRALRDLFYGLSLGSVLLLAALGLAITFGLMGVINMAHGEMLMLGAYSTYVLQELFTRCIPSLADWYLVAAIPLAFLVPCAVGMVLERTIIRYLYGRPLETLLATWGISLGLIQTVRLIFGAQNVEVRNPEWLSGGFELIQGLMITYNRVAIIVFVVFVVALIWFLLNRTPLGLQVRAVTQNRSTASAMGIHTGRIDMLTFGLGSGIAGLGGLALTQVGNVGPELGQSYIVDSFMVVVLGGVGKLAGTVVGSLGLGVVNKILEPFTGAVLGKIMVLGLIILFIQKRPQGIFALKGRMAED
jgi:urea transport system permease protein